MPATTKVLLDTDIGVAGDIDDALCLAYLLSQPACELLGITTVSWDTERRAMVASALCRAAGRRVPVFPGASTPLLSPLPLVGSQERADAEASLLARWSHDEAFPRGQAIEFMRQTIRDHPGEVVLLAIGPLTNVALLFAADPDVAGLLRALVLMAGMFSPGDLGDAGEWNARVDPHATAMVYRAPVATHRSIGVDVTRRVALEVIAVQRALRADGSRLLRAMVEAWSCGAEHITFHDPLAAATIFDDRLCRFERGTVEVELGVDQYQGATYWSGGGPDPRHQVAVDVERKRFFDHYFSIVR